MTKFKVGDRIETMDADDVLQKGTVDEIDVLDQVLMVGVMLDSEPELVYWYHPHELTLI